MNNNRFYVYEHWRPDRGECFYVGKGQTHRAYQMKHGRNLHHRAITSKVLRLGMVIEVKIISQGLNDEEACAKEIERIAFWRNDGADLANMSSGGEKAALGVKRSPEFIQAIIERNRSRKGKVSAETKAKMADRMKGNTHTLGRKQSPQERVEREAQYAKRRGIPRTPDVIEKLRAARIANQTFKGKKHTPEVHARIAAGRAAYWAAKKSAKALAGGE
jgi:NUMOD3 motif